jgi:carboxypeptidase T
MRTILLLLLCLLGSLSVFGQTSARYHRAQVHLEGRSLQELALLGLEVDHGEYVPQRHLTNDFSETELHQITLAGFTYDILIPDVQDYYHNPERQQAYRGQARGGSPCPEGDRNNVAPYPTPSNFHLGSMAGFFTYQEMLDILDSMRLLYPNLISSRQIVSPSIVTHQGRPIYWLRISDNPDTDEATEPEVLYTALHHAREPNSLSQMIYYMWYLLENYETNPEVQFLVANTELYFMPCINPDGYIFNQEIEPNGGGMWRKNLRDNGNGTTGVDLNRNYGYEWGFDNFGSSTNPSSATYRGPEAFSEPETQAVQAFCNAHTFVACLNYHTYGNLLVYPWGYSDTPTDDAPTFNTLADVMTLQNNYLAGTGTTTVGYTTNGDSDDWMYGETGTKPAIFSMTPEVGSGDGGFWPVREDIIPNCRASLWMNLMAANTPHPAGIVQADPAQREIASTSLFFRYQLQRFGLAEGPLTVRLSSLQEDLLIVAEEPRVFNLAPNAAVLDSFALSAVASIAPGTELRFLLQVDNGSFTRTDTVSRVFGGFLSSVIYADNFTELSPWTADAGWGLTTEDFVSAPTSLNDSPGADYPNNSITTITLDEAITVGEAEAYLLRFWSKWDIEAFYDWAQLQFKVNDGDWIPACGRYTVSGSAVQAPEQPIWEGQQPNWVEEEIDLTSYLTAGDALGLRFLLVSDEFVNPDGFYVDDLVLQERNMETVGTTTPLPGAAFSVHIVPNPAREQAQLQFRLPARTMGAAHWQLYQAAGQLVAQGTLNLHNGYHDVDLATGSLPAGVYWLTAQADHQVMVTQKLVVIK